MSCIAFGSISPERSSLAIDSFGSGYAGTNGIGAVHPHVLSYQQFQLSDSYLQYISNESYWLLQSFLQALTPGFKLKMASLSVFIRSFFLTILLSLVTFSCADLVRHDESFYPDYILRITARNISVDCQSHISVIVNGSSPGPPLYLKEDQTTWVRVYNDMSDQNLTMVRACES